MTIFYNRSFQSLELGRAPAALSESGLIFLLINPYSSYQDILKP